MATTPEGKVKAKVDRLLKSYGKEVWFAKMQTGGFGKSGVPDYICCVNSYTVVIETKATEKQQPTALQTLELLAVKAAGGLSLVINADNIAGLQSCLDQLLALPSRNELTTGRK